MKKKFFIFCLILLFTFSVSGCTSFSKTSDCIRIHIRANSNDNLDQAVKLKVRDEVIKSLTPLLANCESKNQAYTVIFNNLDTINNIADNCLIDNGFNYVSKVSLKKENFPARKYLNFTFPSGEYDSLIIELGSGQGDNWWCVAFPPLCFIPTDSDMENFKYKSKLLEIIEQYKEVNNE